MSVVLDGSVGQRVLLYGINGTSLIKQPVTLSGFAKHQIGYDAIVNKKYDANVGNHGWTNRWTYTVPAGKIAILQYFHLHLGPSTAVASCYAGIDCTFTGGTYQTLAYLDSITTNQSSKEQSGLIYLQAGEVLNGYSANGDVVNRWISVYAQFLEVLI